MRKFSLTLAERFILQPALANIPPGRGTMDGALKALKILQMIQLDEDERKLLPQGIIDLDLLPESPKEFKLEDANYEWLVNYIEIYPNWQARKSLPTMRKKIKEAEEFEL